MLALAYPIIVGVNGGIQNGPAFLEHVQSEAARENVAPDTTNRASRIKHRQTGHPEHLDHVINWSNSQSQPPSMDLTDSPPMDLSDSEDFVQNCDAAAKCVASHITTVESVSPVVIVRSRLRTKRVLPDLDDTVDTGYKESEESDDEDLPTWK